MQRSGYTLVELLVVIAILALVAALATPASSRVIESITLRSDAVLIAGKLRGLEDDAVRTQTPITLAPATGALRTTSGHIVYSSSSLSTEIKQAITFYPDGTTDGGTLHLRDRSRDIAIEMAWLTGDVRVENE